MHVQPSTIMDHGSGVSTLATFSFFGQSGVLPKERGPEWRAERPCSDKPLPAVVLDDARTLPQGDGGIWLPPPPTVDIPSRLLQNLDKLGSDVQNNWAGGGWCGEPRLRWGSQWSRGGTNDAGVRGNVRHQSNPIMRGVSRATAGPLAAPWRPFGPTVLNGVTNG